MKATFFARLTNLRVNGSLGRGIQFMDGFYITNDRQYIMSLVDKRYMSSIGSLEYRFILEGPVAYSIIDGVEEKDYTANTVDMLNKLNWFEHFFWVIQDCCVGHEVGFIASGARITSVRHGGFYTLASGEAEELECSADAFRSAVRSIREGSDIRRVDFSNKDKTHNTKKMDRVWLALHLIGYARWTVFIPNKIAFYCSAIEALLSTSQSELSHQIAERVSVVINTAETRIETYKFIKKCYSLRSKYIHGDTVSQSEVEVVRASEKLDAIVRATLHAIFDDENLRQALNNNSSLDDILLSRVLSYPSPA
jgi:hypothetical protein